MRKFTNLLVSLIALISVTTVARADLIAPPEVQSSGHSWVVILVIVVVIVIAGILHKFRKK